MKQLLVMVALAFTTTAFAAEPAKPAAKAEENTKCVKKDKNGKCPPLPDSPKPTPKKKVEEKKA